MKNGSTNIGLMTQLGEIMSAAYGVGFAGKGFYVLYIGLFGCVNLCCNGFMDINSVFWSSKHCTWWYIKS